MNLLFRHSGKEFIDGQNLKGKECGKGICQRKDGKYAARYTGKNGKRQEKHFLTLPEAKNWLADMQYEDKHDVYNPSSEMTVDAWFESGSPI